MCANIGVTRKYDDNYTVAWQTLRAVDLTLFIVFADTILRDGACDNGKRKKRVRLFNTKHQAKTRTRKAFAVAPHKTETSTPREEKTFKVVGEKTDKK